MLRGLPAELDEIFARLKRFRGAWVSGGWSWDRRLDCVASTFDIADADEARRLLTSLFAEEWTSVTLADAPSLIIDVAETSGGVRSDQLLFATPDASVIAYGLWWPWGSGATSISMRVGLLGRISEDDMMMLREIFGAPDT